MENEIDNKNGICLSLPKSFEKLDLEKIRECIEVLSEHYKTLLISKNIHEAQKAEQRINLLKEIEKQKLKTQANIIYTNQQDLVKEKLEEELTNYIINSDKEYKKLLTELENQEKEIEKQEELKIKNEKNNIEMEFKSKIPKPSKKYLDLSKIRDCAFKLNNLEKAKEVSADMLLIEEQDKNKFDRDKKEKINNEINKILKKFETEKKALNIKRENSVNEFNTNRNKNIELIKKKYDTKLNELKNYQNFEKSNFEKIIKGISKPCSRIKTIISSTNAGKKVENSNNNS